MKEWILPLWLAVFSLIAFCAFGIDKSRAKRHQYRIPEASLLALCLLGGAIGGLLGMTVFRHKTRKPLFFIPVPLLALLQAGAVLWRLFSSITL